jgi:hypothetical protein
MALEFSGVEKHVLRHTGGYSKQLIHYWERAGYVPSRHVLRVHKLLGRKLEDLLGGDEEATRPREVTS